ncbi:hypothetical protein B0J15DRAFT_530455 [Fusarium solani]|uniref:Uncharacterized protein n=1 Tax=Fusarium solani TaxID=169388 RepID=A0A9P9JSQ6_FUSSL|nr:uncharacterized protein B0J15DRAFT_530455 [Fusarium solani]KAH7231926.1 hypothetical protein B0J15DRAFT_530455 [Fusarium solani]
MTSKFSQFGSRSPRGSGTDEIGERASPLPPHLNSFIPQFSQPQYSQPVQYSQPPQFQQPPPLPPPFAPPPNSYSPYDRGNHYQEPAATSPRRFSWPSALGQVPQSVLNGGPVGSPQVPSYSHGTSSVIVNGVELRYDRRSGGYGSVGGPCTGFMVAGLGLGNGKLHPHASGNTGTGVWINGREIHAMDVAGLQAMGVWSLILGKLNQAPGHFQALTKGRSKTTAN